MKNLFCLLLIFSFKTISAQENATTAFAQEDLITTNIPIDGFLLSKWGATFTEVIEDHSEKEYTWYGDSARLFTRNVTFAGYDNCTLGFLFTEENEFACGYVGFANDFYDKEEKMLAIFDELTQKLRDKYGESNSDVSYINGYTESPNDWGPIFNYRMGIVEFEEMWVDNTRKNGMVLNLKPQGELELYYFNALLFDKILNNINEEEADKERIAAEKAAKEKAEKEAKEAKDRADL